MKPAKLSRLRTFLAGPRRLNHDSRFAIHDLRRKCGFILAAVFCVIGVCAMASAQGTFASNVVAGNWNVSGSWTLVSGADGDGVPDADDNVFVQVGHVITLTGNEACNDLNISTGTTANNVGGDGRLALGSNTLQVNGKLRSYIALLGTTPGTSDSTPPATPITITAASAGKLSFVGNTRNIINAGEWSASNTASTTTFAVEINMNSGQTATMQASVKASTWNIVAGTVDAGTNRLAADVGVATGSDITIGAGAIVRSAATGSGTSAVFGRTAGGLAGVLTLNGSLFLTGSAPTVGMTTITLNGLVEYGASGAQTFASAINSGADPTTYTTLKLSGTGLKTTVASKITTINANGSLEMAGGATPPTFAVGAAGTFSVNATGTTIIYSATGAQTTGTEWVTNFQNAKINNSAGVTLNAVKTINGALTIGDLVSNSIFNDGGFQVTSTGTLNLSNGSTFKLGSAGTGTSFPAFGTRIISVGTTVEYASNQPQTIAAINYSNLTSSGSGARTLASTGTIGIGEIFTPGGGNTYTITGSTIDFLKGLSQTIPSFNYNNLSNSGNGPRTYTGTVGIAGTFDPGGGGPHVVTGSTIEYNGTSAQNTITSAQGFTYNNLSINNPAGVTLPNLAGQFANVNSTLFLKNGPFTLTNPSELSMANGATINRSGGSISATPGAVGTYNVTYSGSAALLAGPEIPSSSSVLGNLTLAQTVGDIDAEFLGYNTTVNGTLAMNQDTNLYMGSNILVMGTSSAATTSGTGQGDVIGKVTRSSFPSSGAGANYNFGSPYVQFRDFTNVSVTQIDVTLTPERPVDFAEAVRRTYQIDVSGTATATLRLHYRDAELQNAGDEPTLDLWEGPAWTDQVATARDATNNWVERAAVATFSPWALAPPTPGPTAVKLSKFNAASFVDGVQLTWESGFEVNNLGYRLYREQNGKRTRVTPSIVAGSTLLVGQGNRLTAGYSYSWFDPQGTPGTAYYLEAIDLDSSRQTHGPIYPYGGSRNGVSPKRQRALLLNELGKSLANNSGGADAGGWPASMSAAARSETLKLKPQSLAAQQAIAGGKAVKLQVRQSGWYRVTQPELVAAGFDPSSDARLLQLYVDGEEVPVRLSAEGARLNANDTLEFYGVALDTQTTDTRTYWLVNGTTAGKRISAKRNKIKAGDQNWTESAGLRSFAFTAERREKLVYSPRLLNGDGENIFGALIFTDATDQTLAVKNFDRESATPVQLEVALQGLTAQAHEVHIMLNGAELGSMTFAASAHSTARFAVNRALLREGDNTVSLTSNNGDADISFVDYLRLTYAHQYTADNNALRFSVPGGGVVRVDGFSTANIRVVDITDPNSPLELATSGSPSGTGYSVKVQALGNDTRTLMAFADDMTAHPASITANKPSNWNASTNGADLVIITHKDFRQAVEPLATLRRNQGLSVAMVDAEDVYDEFSYGAHTPSAIKAFLMNAAGTWSRKPGYLLLVGDSSWDPRNFMDQGANDFVPTKLIDTNYMETASDDWLVDFTGQGHAEMALGRLPGRTAAEVSLMVSKIMAYEQERELNEPLRGAVMVADDGFETQSAQTSALLPAGVAKQSLNRAAIGNDDLMRGQLLDALNQGPMIVNFYGHGSVGVWTGAGILDSELADTLTNSNRSSIYLMMTCLNGYAHDAYVDSLSESVLKAPNGGAVAVWASSGFTPTEPQFAMDSQFYRLLFGGQPLRLGEAARQAKLATSDLDVRRTWILLGDPTMRVR